MTRQETDDMAGAWNCLHPIGTLVWHWADMFGGHPTGAGRVTHAARALDADVIVADISGCPEPVLVSLLQAVDCNAPPIGKGGHEFRPNDPQRTPADPSLDEVIIQAAPTVTIEMMSKRHAILIATWPDGRNIYVRIHASKKYGLEMRGEQNR